MTASSIKPITLAVVFVLLMGAIVLAPIPEAHAPPDCIWTGTGLWTDTSHWSCGHVPGTSDSVEIASGTVTVTGTQSYGFIHVDSGATLTCDSCTLTSSASGGDITIDAGGTFNNDGGTITVLDGELTNSGTFNNRGIFQLTNGAGFILNQAGGTIFNTGTISAGGSIPNSGTIINCGGTITAVGR